MQNRPKELMCSCSLGTTDKTAAVELDDLQKEFFDWLISENPQFATSIGIHKFDDQVNDYSLGVVDRWKTAVDKYLEKLEEVPRSSLSDKQQVDFDVFKDFLTSYKTGYEWRDFNSVNPINYLEGPHIDPAFLAKITPKETRGDFVNFIARLEGLPSQITQFKSRFQRAVDVGRTYHHACICDVPDQIASTTPSNPEDHAFYAVFKDPLDQATAIPEHVKNDLRNQAKLAIQNYTNSLRDLSEYLQNDYSKHLRQGYGVCTWDKGADFYKAVLQWHLSLPLTPEEVHQKGKEEVERISKQTKQILSRLGYSGSVKDGIDAIMNDPKFYLKTGEEIIERYKQIIYEEIEPKLSMVFKDLPDVPVNVVPMPNDGPRGVYLPGAADGSRPGVFQVNISRPAETLTTEFMALALHETNPGHHLQLISQRQAKLPEYRKNMLEDLYSLPPLLFPFYTAHMEGWALYAESLGEEMGLYKSDYDLLGRYASEIFRACRLVVDTGLHYYNWTKEQAMEYMKEHTALGENKIANEINRYATWPGQACAYKIGELKIWELRRKAKEELGSCFDLKDFHAVILQNGPMPLTILETLVDKWIMEVKTKQLNAENTINTNIVSRLSSLNRQKTAKIGSHLSIKRQKSLHFGYRSSLSRHLYLFYVLFLSFFLFLSICS